MFAAAQRRPRREDTIDRWWRIASQAYDRLSPREGWGPLIFLAIPLLVLTLSVDRASWIDTMPRLGHLVLLAILVGLAASKVRLPGLIVHTLAMVLGTAVVAYEVSNTIPDVSGTLPRLEELGVRMEAWLRAMQTGGMSSDPAPFALGLAALGWLVGYSSSWFVFHSHRVWLAVVPGGAALLVNLSYLPSRYAPYFFFYLMGSLLLVMSTTLARERGRWRAEGTRYPWGIGLSWFSYTLTVSAAIALVAWVLPWSPLAGQLKNAWGAFEEPWENLQFEFSRLFADVRAQKPIPLHTFGTSLPFRGRVRLGNEVVMEVRAEEPGYWRGITYDIYTSQGWKRGPTESLTLHPGGTKSLTGDFALREPVVQEFVLHFPSNLLFSRGYPVDTIFTTKVDLMKNPVYEVPLRKLVDVPDLPPDIAKVVPGLRNWALTYSTVSDQALRRLLPPDIELVDTRGSAEDLTALLTWSDPDVSALKTFSRLPAGRRYSVLSLVSVAPEDALRQASADYPGWVTERYLQLPDELPVRVRRLARTLTDTFDNPFDKAEALKRYLRGIEYSEDIDAPPFGWDGVDYFLFIQRKGYCDYYASAMAVMLRSLGIPARVATGYVSGNWDGDRYIVRGKHAHTWTEVYFPEYGWIEFNPTPIWPPVFRPLTAPERTYLEGEEEEEPGLIPGQLPEATEVPEGAPSASPAAGTQWPLALAPGALAALLMLVAAAYWLLWIRGTRGVGPGLRVYERMCRLASWAGVGPRPGQTPTEYARELGEALPQESEDVRAIAAEYSRERFGRKTASREEGAQVTTAWRRVRRRLWLRLLRWRE